MLVCHEVCRQSALKRKAAHTRAVTNTVMESWTQQQVYEWVVKEFNEETAREFEGLLLSHYTSTS